MKTRTRISVTAGAVILALTAIVISANNSKAIQDDNTQWEYLVVSGGNVNLTSMTSDQFSNMRKQPDSSFGREAFTLERNFDKLGAKGWQLVAVHGAQQEPVYYFKRVKNK